MFDPELNQEVIRFDLPLKKQIRVEVGTEVEEVDNPALAKAGNGGKSSYALKNRMIERHIYYFKADLAHLIFHFQ